MAKLSVGREDYYLRELATDHEQYLSGHGEFPGRWYGAGASSLGLQGEASPAGFQAMCQDTRLYAVVGPEPQGSGELDLPDREQPDGYVQLAQALSRAGGQRLAIDTPTSLDLRQLSTAELRAERDRLRRQLDQAPPRPHPGAGPGHRPPPARRADPSRPPTAHR